MLHILSVYVTLRTASSSLRAEGSENMVVQVHSGPKWVAEASRQRTRWMSSSS
jgi:hypothetical protein